MKKTIAIVAASQKASLTIKGQLERLIGSFMNFKAFSLSEWEQQTSHFPLILISTEKFIKYIVPKVKSQTDFLIIRRTLSRRALEKILEIPKGKKVLIVNDHVESVEETIALLYELGINHLDFVPYYPNYSPQMENIEIAITPNEIELVPKNVKYIVNMGERMVDVNTVINILTRLDLFDSKTYNLIPNYSEEIVSRYYGLQTTLSDLEDTRSILLQTMNMIDSGVIAYDKYHEILFLNETAEKIFLTNSAKQIGRKLIELLKDSNIDIDLNQSLEDYIDVINHKNIILNNNKITGEQGSGVLTIQFADRIQDTDLKIRAELKNKGHKAKYHFHDIVSRSSQMNETISFAKKIAKSDLTVLILGENGTGKELFSHSIHNYSDRKNYPFVAVNFSSLPENLLESELFGYEDGAFTGAKKGGKPGLFEQAHKGTIFLDEIGDITPNLQTRLLRVLEQKEVIKVGGSSIISVDVRIIAATNRDLSTLVKENKFRADLYYRLKVMQVSLPPLREIKEDLTFLINNFLKQKNLIDSISPDIINALNNYHWPGNIRELKNMVDYLSIMHNEIKGASDLPFESDFITSIPIPKKDGAKQIPIIEHANPKDNPIPFRLSKINPQNLILPIIHSENSKGKGIGRRSIIERSKKMGILFTENEMRSVLNDLKSAQLIEIKLGRTGCQLTQKGYNYIIQNKRP